MPYAHQNHATVVDYLWPLIENSNEEMQLRIWRFAETIDKFRLNGSAPSFINNLIIKVLLNAGENILNCATLNVGG